MKREEVLMGLISRLAQSKVDLASSFGPSALGTTVIRNQLVMLDALAYLVEHMTEQAWKDRPIDATGAQNDA
jgi:hypothetical protein